MSYKNKSMRYSGLSVAVACALFANTAVAQSTSDYERRIQNLENEIKSLKAYQQNDEVSSEKEGEFVRAGGTPRSFVVPGTDTELALGGFIHLEAAAGESGSGLPSEPTFAPVLLNTPFGDVDGKDTALEFSARRSRLWLKSNTPAGGNALTTHVEVDFYGSDGSENFTNSHDIRLRRAFAEYGNWMVGQNYSTFLDFASLGEILNFGQHANSIFIRQPQVRYTMPMSWGGVMFSAENAFENSMTTVSGSLSDNDQDDQAFPDLVARTDINFGKVHTSLKLLGRNLTVDSAGNGEDDSTWAGAVSATARFPVLSDSLGLQYNYGAVGRYLELGLYPDAYVEDGEVKPFNVWGASAVYSHRWGGDWNWRSTLAYAYTAADESMDKFAGNIADTSSSAQINLFWNPAKNTTLGIEYGLYELETADGTEFDASRIHASAKFAF